MVSVIQFKNDNGVWITKGMFYETAINDSNIVYTLKDEDYKGYKSLKKLYMNSDDITEYSFVIDHLGGWDHWEALLACKWFLPYVTSWRNELEVRTRARALEAIKREAADATSKNSFSANKLLLDRGWLQETSKNKRGAPTKDEVKKAATELARASEDLEGDFGRVIQLNGAR